MTGPIVALIISVVVVFIVATGTRIVRPWQRGIIERMGKYQRTVGSGLTIIIPIIENIAKIDMREQVVDVPPQEVITRDNVVVSVDAVIYYEITDPVKVRYNVANFYYATTKLAQTNLRNLIGDMALDESLTSRETINSKLRKVLDDATDKWGARATRVEIQKIEPPSDVMEAMHRQMKAERIKRATILEAEGAKQAAILEAEGQKQSAILRAEGEAGAIQRIADAERYKRQTVAKGEGEAVVTVFNAIHQGNPTNDLIAIKYLEALQKIADGNANKVFLPLETVGILGSIAGIGELFKEKEGSKK